MAGNSKTGPGRSEFGLDGTASHGWLTYRAIDAAVTVALYGLIWTLPLIVPVVNRLCGGRAAGPHAPRSTARPADGAPTRSETRLAA